MEQGRGGRASAQVVSARGERRAIDCIAANLEARPKHPAVCRSKTLHFDRSATLVESSLRPVSDHDDEAELRRAGRRNEWVRFAKIVSALRNRGVHAIQPTDADVDVSPLLDD